MIFLVVLTALVVTRIPSIVDSVLLVVVLVGGDLVAVECDVDARVRHHIASDIDLVAYS